MRSTQVRVGRIAVMSAFAGLGLLSGCGVLSQGGGAAVTERPAELVVWGDPDPDNEGTGSTIQDVNNLEDRYVAVGTDDSVQFADGSVCSDCEVVDATIWIDDVPRVNIRFGPGPDGGITRRPFLVSTDGFYIELVETDEGISFQEENLVFEDPDDPSDDLAVRVGTVPNPLLESSNSRSTSACGSALASFLPLTLLGIAGMRLTRRGGRVP